MVAGPRHGRKRPHTCQVKSVAAGQIEGAVFTYLRDIFADPEMVARTFRATRDQSVDDRAAMKRQKTALEKRMADLRKAIGRLVRADDGKADGALSVELRTLNDEYAQAENRLRELVAEGGAHDDLPSEQDVSAALRTIEPLWEELFLAEKERIVRLLVETVTVRPDVLSIRLRPTGLITLASEVAPDGAEEPELEEATV